MLGSKQFLHIDFEEENIEADVMSSLASGSREIRSYNIIVNSSPPGQNGRHFPDDILSCIFMNEKFCILIKISLKFVA